MAREGFDDAVRTLLAPLRHFCERMLGDRQEAEDAAQQAWLLAYRAWEGFEGRSSRKTWIFRIAANVCARALERRRERGRDALPGELGEPGEPGELGELGEPAREADPSAALEAAERERAVREVLGELRPAHRMVLVLFCLDELSHAEIAELLGCPEGTAWSRLHHARRAFEERLRRRGLDGEVTT